MTISPLLTRKAQSLYDADYLDWIETTLQQLKDQDYSRVDWENLLEEVEGLSRRAKDGFESNLAIAMMHLLKWQYQPERRSRSWTGSIVERRRRLRKAMKHLNPYLENVFAESLR